MPEYRSMFRPVLPMSPPRSNLIGLAALRLPLAVKLAPLVCAIVSGCGGGFSHPGSGSSGGGSPVSTQVSGANPASTPPCSSAVAGSGETFTAGAGIQPQVTVIPGGNVVGVWEQDRWSGGPNSAPSGGLGARAIATAHSSDGGSTWSTPVVLPFSMCAGGTGPGATYDRASDPWLTFAANGVVVASALALSATGTAFGSASAGGLSAVLASRSTDGGKTWSTPFAVIQDSNPTGSAAFFFNDRDSITADTAGNVYLVWDRLSTGVNASMPAYLALSKDSGQSWTTGVLYDPGAGNEAFNNEIAILPSGAVLDFFSLLDLATGTSTLQVVGVTVSGTTWSTPSPPVMVATIQSVGTKNPIPNGTAIRASSLIAQIAVDPATGAVAAVWQQLFGSSSSDGIALSISTDGGTTWSTPKQVNGAAAAAAFSPTVRYLPGSVLALTYYDLRDYATGSTVLNTDVWLSESNDNGGTWHELRIQGPFDLNSAPLALNNMSSGFTSSTALFLGDNQGLGLVGSNPLPLAAATTSAGARVYATLSPSPLTSPGAHIYAAAAARPVAAAAAARARATVLGLRGRYAAGSGSQ